MIETGKWAYSPNPASFASPAIPRSTAQCRGAGGHSQRPDRQCPHTPHHPPPQARPADLPVPCGASPTDDSGEHRDAELPEPTLAPGSGVSATIRAFNASGQQRRSFACLPAASPARPHLGVQPRMPRHQTGSFISFETKKGFQAILSLSECQEKDPFSTMAAEQAYSRLGQKVIISTAGEKAEAFVPPRLTPIPIVRMEGLHRRLESASRALGQLDGVTSILRCSSACTFGKKRCSRRRSRVRSHRSQISCSLKVRRCPVCLSMTCRKYPTTLPP